MNPKIIYVNDYHEIEQIERHLHLVDTEYHCIEVAFHAPMYVGLIYHGTKPSETEIDNLMKDDKS